MYYVISIIINTETRYKYIDSKVTGMERTNLREHSYELNIANIKAYLDNAHPTL